MPETGPLDQLDTQEAAAVRRRVLELRAEGRLDSIDIAPLVGLTPREVQEILAGPRRLQLQPRGMPV